MRLSPGVIVVVLAAACAPAPETIAPAAVSEVPYRGWSCDQLGDELQRLAAALATAALQQNSVRSSDKIGVIYTGLPLASLAGHNLAPQIALYKGQQDAVHRASVQNKCPELTRLAPTSAVPSRASG
jgi:hypothetical protein